MMRRHRLVCLSSIVTSPPSPHIHSPTHPNYPHNSPKLHYQKPRQRVAGTDDIDVFVNVAFPSRGTQHKYVLLSPSYCY